MNRIKISILIGIVFIGTVVFSAEKEPDPKIPPWMEDIKGKGRSTYLVPKGAKRELIGTHMVVEPPSEYVARRLYEIENALEARFSKIEKNQEELKSMVEELKKELEEIKKNQKDLNEQDVKG